MMTCKVKLVGVDAADMPADTSLLGRLSPNGLKATTRYLYVPDWVLVNVWVLLVVVAISNH